MVGAFSFQRGYLNSWDGSLRNGILNQICMGAGQAASLKQNIDCALFIRSPKNTIMYLRMSGWRLQRTSLRN